MSNTDHIFESAPYGFIYSKLSFDKQGLISTYHIESVNSAFEEFFGIKADQLIGQKISALDDSFPFQQGKWSSFLQQVAENEGKASQDFFDLSTKKWYYVQAWMADEKHLAATFIDITEKKKEAEHLKTTSSQFREVFDRVPHSVFVIDVTDDQRFIIRDFNEIQLKYLNMTRNDIQGNFVKDVFPEEVADSIISYYTRCLEVGKEIRYEEDVELPGRGRRQYLTTLSPIKNEKGQIYRLIGSSIEITDRKQAEKALKKSEEKYRSFVQNSSEGIYLFEFTEPLDLSLDASEQIEYIYKEGYISACNDVMARMYGYEKSEELEGKKLIQFHGSDDIPENIENLKNLVASNYQIKDQLSIEKDLEGNDMYILNSTQGIIEDNKLIRVWATQRDVTQRVKAEQKLEESEELLSATLRSIGDAVISCDRSGTVMSVNQVAERLTGWTAEEAIGHDIEDVFKIFNSKTRKKAKNPVQKALDEGVIVGLANHTILLSKDGSEYQIADSCAPIKGKGDEILGCVLVFRDVTTEYKQREALRESEKRFRTLAYNVPGVIYLCNNDERYTMTFINDQVKQLTGYNSDMFLNDEISFADLYHPEDAEWIPDEVDRALQNHDAFQLNYRIRHRDGDWRWVLEHGIGIYDEEGQLQHLEGYLTDITERKEAEELAYKASQQLEFHINNSPLAVIISDENFHVKQWSESAEELFGWSEEEVLSFDPEEWQFTHENDKKKVQEKIDELVKGRKSSNQSRNRNYTKNGDLLHCEWYNSAMFDQNGDIISIFSLVHDVSDRKEKQQQLEESLAEKETLLSEIHHRVKNNLAVVSGMMQLQAYETENETLQAKLFDSVIRIKTMATVHELLYQSNSFSKLDFSDTITKLVENISETLQTSTEINLDIQSDHIKLNINKAIPASLIVNEVVTNIYKHAFVDMDEGKIEFRVKQKNGEIRISIKDNGIGINEDKLENTGSLGMHLINELSTQIDGEYEYKRANHGTEFTLQFHKE